jgi:hypothetical protein
MERQGKEHIYTMTKLGIKYLVDNAGASLTRLAESEQVKALRREVEELKGYKHEIDEIKLALRTVREAQDSKP